MTRKVAGRDQECATKCGAQPGEIVDQHIGPAATFVPASPRPRSPRWPHGRRRGRRDVDDGVPDIHGMGGAGPQPGRVCGGSARPPACAPSCPPGRPRPSPGVRARRPAGRGRRTGASRSPRPRTPSATRSVSAAFRRHWKAQRLGRGRGSTRSSSRRLLGALGLTSTKASISGRPIQLRTTARHLGGRAPW